ncbi:hypothetical protein ACEPAI_7304 [Sanghuangporus weigelae]
MLTCTVCPERTFATPVALHQHQSHSKGHFYCRSCTSTFADYNALFDHATAVHSATCEGCRRMFASEKGAQRHLYDSPRHPKCRSCRMGFRDCAGLNSHKAEVHGLQKSPKRTPRRGRKNRIFSPTASNSDNTSTPTSSLRLWSPLSSATSQVSDSDSMIFKLSIASQYGDDAPASASPTLSDASHDIGLLPSDEQPQKDQTNVFFSTGTCGFEVASPMKTGRIAATEHRFFQTYVQDEQLPSLHRGEKYGSQSSPVSQELHVKSNELGRMQEGPGNGLSTPADANINFSSPLLETDTAFPTDVHSDTSSDNEDISTGLRLSGRLPGRLAYRRSSPQPCQTSQQGDHGDATMVPLLCDRLGSQDSSTTRSGFADAIRAACRARSGGVVRPPAPLRLNNLSSLKIVGTLPWLSQLPTILDEQEMGQGQDAVEYEPGSMEEPVVETRPELHDITRAGRRKRRLSLSPTLPSIPEAVNIHELGPMSAVDPYDPDSDSSKGIYEHRGQDFLYDSLSETERCHTPMTYLTADDLDLQADEEGNLDYPREISNVLTEILRTEICPASPTLLVEDLTKIAEEMCSPSTTDGEFYDSSADPFELHPSANNSPMSATFPKRLRAWSLSDAPYDSRFLSPSRSKIGLDHTKVIQEDRKLNDVIGGENEEPDEAAVTADESQPRAIEEDLFSEPDETMEHVPHGIEPVIESEEARFAEEGHPLRSLISLDTLPLTDKVPNLPNRSEHSFPSRSDSNDTAASGEHEAVPGRCPLRCRICQLDPCKEVTATFCGHIFCHECITREIMERSKCPVCSAPTLLYCLFNLDLSS